MSDFRSKRVLAVPVKPRNTAARATPFNGHEKRRGVRMNSQVRVAVEWNSGGELRRREAHTRIVGPYGCMMVLSQHLNVDQHIQVTNLVSSQSNPAVVVWRGNERAEGWELGIELINPEMNFWGIDL
jgi:hypothetical protein